MTDVPSWIAGVSTAVLALIALGTLAARPFKKISERISRFDRRIDTIETNQNVMVGMLRNLCSSEVNEVADHVITKFDHARASND